ncbi:hypothetical protein F5882DRAFT_453250, partial [Hyaloscypha sp. PMI_1271]
MSSNSSSDLQAPNPLPTPPSSRQLSGQPAPPVTPSTSDNTDLWERAYEIFQKQEPELAGDYNKQLLGNATAIADTSSRLCIETALKKLLEDRERKQLKISFPGHNLKIRKQVERLTTFLQWSGPVVKATVSAQPFAALAWSGVCLLLPLLTSNTTQNEAMLEGFNSIGDLQFYWKSCEETCLRSEHRQQYQRLLEPLVKLYSLIFAYQAYVICHLSKAQHSRAWKNLISPNFWNNKLEDIDRLNKNCSRLIDASREREIQQNRDSQLQELQRLRIIQQNVLQGNEEDRRDEKETKLLQDLAVAAGDYKRYKNINPHRVDGTCEWFLTDERFRKWRDSTTPSLLWVSAGPGCGKSVLSRSLIDDGQLATCVTTITFTPSSIDAVSSRESTICYFFFKGGGDGQMDSAHALCALLHQLFTWPSTSGLIKHALRSHREHGATLTRKFSELWQILSDCVTSPDAGEIICVLDALDECKQDSRQDFINTLKGFYSRGESISISSTRLRFLVTSRPYPDLESSFQKFRTTTAYLRLDGDEKSEQIRQEINLVIDARLQDITDGFTANDQRKISERLKSMEHRTYLWLHLTFNIIEKSPTEFGKRSDIEKLLSHLPSQVSDAYERILSRSTNRSRTEILLRIMLAAVRPLTLDEANVALTLAIQEQQPVSYADVEADLWPRDKFRSIVTNLCGLFVSVYNSKLSFIHQTAREFLLDSEQEGNWKGRFDMPQSHSAISRACLFQLLSPDINRPPKDDPAQDKRHPYFAYAASYWPLHFVSQEVTNADSFRRHARTLCNTAGHQASIWAPSYLKQRDLRWKGCSDLTLASYLGLSEVVYDILFKEKPNVNIEATDSHYRQTALSWAAENGHKAVVELLLEKGAKIKAKDKHSQTALLRATEGGHEAVVELLLEKGAEIEAADKYGQTALLQAARNGHEAIVELLLEKGAEIEAKDDTGQTALLQATWNRDEAIINLLLDKGAEIEAKDEFGRTALLEAAECGYEAIIDLLLKNGAEIEAKDKLGWTALLLATGNKHEAIIKLLLEKGAKVEVKDELGQTALLQAAESGYKAIIELLLEKGAVA